MTLDCTGMSNQGPSEQISNYQKHSFWKWGNMGLCSHHWSWNLTSVFKIFIEKNMTLFSKPFSVHVEGVQEDLQLERTEMWCDDARVRLQVMWMLSLCGSTNTWTNISSSDIEQEQTEVQGTWQSPLWCISDLQYITYTWPDSSYSVWGSASLFPLEVIFTGGI